MRKIFEIQHKLYQQQVRLCSTGRLQEAIKVEEEQDYAPKINEIKQEASSFYYPVQKPFKHDVDIGEQFTVSSLVKKFKFHDLNASLQVHC